jgi:hypothetical protein
MIGDLMVTKAVPTFVLSALDTAEIETVGGFGTIEGAVYKPVGSMLPLFEISPVAPLICQDTCVLLSPWTVAANCCCWVGNRPEVGGVTKTTGACTVTLAVANFATSASETADTVTAAGLGTTAGAVYIPSLSIVPTNVFPPLTPFTCH